MLNLPLTFNVHVVDVATDKDESTLTYNIRKAPRYRKVFVNHAGDRLPDDEHSQVVQLEKKYDKLISQIIWAMNNGKELVIINRKDDV